MMRGVLVAKRRRALYIAEDVRVAAAIVGRESVLGKR